MARFGVSRAGALTSLLALVAVAVAAVLIARTASLAAARLAEEPPVVVETIDATSFVRVTVRPGLSGAAIGELLEESGVVTDRRRFSLLLEASGASAELQAGCYELPRRLPAGEVIRRMRAGLTTGRSLTIPEGLRPEEVAERGVQAGIGTLAEWARAFRAREAKPGPGGRHADSSLVGYLFPAVYPLECDSTPEVLVAEMLATFEERVPPSIFDEGRRIGLAPDEVITLASIVEREAVRKDERATIASVYLNRLDDETGLDADPTVQFAIATPESVARFGWWKRELTLTDLRTKSPYNTYVNEGLPPGPIASPGLESILAAVRPDRTDFLYFVAKGDGAHVFAKTLAEHNRNVAAYQQRP